MTQEILRRVWTKNHFRCDFQTVTLACMLVFSHVGTVTFQKVSIAYENDTTCSDVRVFYESGIKITTSVAILAQGLSGDNHVWD